MALLFAATAENSRAMVNMMADIAAIGADPLILRRMGRISVTGRHNLNEADLTV